MLTLTRSVAVRLIRQQPGARFMALWGAQTLSTAGNILFTAAVMWYATKKYGAGISALVLGLSQFLPTTLLAPFAGVLTDRLPRRGLLLTTDLLRGAISLALALVVLTIGASLPLLAVAIMVLRILGVVFQPAMQAMIGDMARESSQLLRMDAWMLASGMVAALLAPGLSVTAVEWGAGVALLANAATFFLSSASLVGIRGIMIKDVEATGSSLRSAATGWLADAKDGVFVAFKDPVFRSAGLSFPFIDMTWSAISLLLPAILIAAKVTNGVWYGGLIAIFSGARFTGLFLARKFLVIARKGPLFAVNACLQGAAVVVIGAYPQPYVMAVALICMGLPSGCASVCVSAYIQTEVDPQLRGRIFSLLLAVSALIMPLGPVITGVSAEFSNVSSGLIYIGLALFLLGLPALTSRTVWRIQ